MPKYTYWTSEGEGLVDEGPYEIENNLDAEESDFDLEIVASACAEDYNDNHDGWESSWPVTFIIEDADGKRLGKVSVERETALVFSGSIINE